MTTEIILELNNIFKSFPGVQALNNVSLTLQAGEVLGICGENGAGKSTLIKILGGVHEPDSGSIRLFGNKVSILDSRVALNLGISTIFQELSLMPCLSVAENIFLGALPHNKFGIIERKKLYAQSKEILETLGLGTSPNVKVSSLGISIKQLIEIGKSLSRNTRILIMDEPTSSLGKDDVKRLFKIIKTLKNEGIGIIYISHHLNEIFEIADNVSVLRDGKLIETRKITNWNTDSLVYAMVNRKLENLYPKRKISIGNPILEVKGVSNKYVEYINFTIRKGEIVAIAGIVGSGRTEILKTLYGVYNPTSGKIKLNGKYTKINSPADAMINGIVYVPENRKEEGLLLEGTVSDNIVLSALSKVSSYGIVNKWKKGQISLNAVKMNNIKTSSIGQKVLNLSGGNQQKVILSRALEVKPQIFLLDEPTKGIDVGSKTEIYEQIMRYAENGNAVLFVSSDLPEILGIADRVLVVKEREIVADLPIDKADQETIMKFATGGI